MNPFKEVLELEKKFNLVERTSKKPKTYKCFLEKRHIELLYCLVSLGITNKDEFINASRNNLKELVKAWERIVKLEKLRT